MRRTMVLAAALAMAACGGSSSTDAGARLVGVYQLSFMHDNSLPAMLSTDAEVTTYLNSEVLTVNAGGTYETHSTEFLQPKIGHGGFETVSSTGTYKASGGGYTFTDGALGSGSGALSGDMTGGTVLTVSLGGVQYVFTKE